MKYQKKKYEEKFYGINAHALHKLMRVFKVEMKARCLFLWNLMSNNMKFIKNPTDLDIKHLEEIKESLGDVFTCAFCQGSIPEVEFACKDCWKDLPKSWYRKRKLEL